MNIESKTLWFNYRADVCDAKLILCISLQILRFPPFSVVNKIVKMKAVRYWYHLF
jgi:hypothetical protein